MTSRKRSRRALSRRCASLRARPGALASSPTLEDNRPGARRTGTFLSPSRSILKRRLPRSAATLWPLAAAAALALAAGPANAHGFGQRYDLPIPLSFYLTGAAAVVVVTFLIVSLFVREVPRAHGAPRIDLLRTGLGRLVAAPPLVSALQLFALGAFIITIAAGFRGDQNPYKNLAPTMVWVIGWVGLAYVCAFVGNLWAVINPWRTIFESIETIDHGSPDGPRSARAYLIRRRSASGPRSFFSWRSRGSSSSTRTRHSRTSSRGSPSPIPF